MEALTRQQCLPSTSGRPAAVWGAPRRPGRQAPCRALQNFELWPTAEMPKGYTPPSVVPGSRTLATPRLSNERVYQRLLEAAHSRANKDFGAFYSSVLGGIVTEPGLMVLHADDHMVTRGHGVYDVVPLVDGYLYQLDRHVGRALAAADAAGVPPSLAPADIKRILLDTAAASIKLNGHVQFWLTPGRGGLGMSSDECTAPGLYALVSSEFTAVEELGRAEGRRATVSPVEPPAAYFGRLKSSSYLQNVVAQLEAESRGFDVGLFVDEEGYVLGGPNAALAIITPDHEFVYAPSDRAPPGITVQTLAELIPEEYDEEDLPIKAVSQRPISLDDLTGSLEALLVNSTLGVMPVTHVDDEAVADGRPGYLSMALQATLINDRKPREGSDRHTPVPYGGLTGMRSQLT